MYYVAFIVYITYNASISCKLCLQRGLRAVYFGETGHSTHYRMKFHMDALRLRTMDSVLYKHQMKMHPGTWLSPWDFKVEVSGRFLRPIVRQCQERVALAKALDDKNKGVAIEIINSKMEFLQPGVVSRQFSSLLS